MFSRGCNFLRYFASLNFHRLWRTSNLRGPILWLLNMYFLHVLCQWWREEDFLQYYRSCIRSVNMILNSCYRTVELFSVKTIKAKLDNELDRKLDDDEWWWIVFVVQLTKKRRLGLFPARTIVRNPYAASRIWTCVEPEFKLCCVVVITTLTRRRGLENCLGKYGQENKKVHGCKFSQICKKTLNSWKFIHTKTNLTKTNFLEN